MDASAIFTMARELSNTNSTDFTNTRLLPFLNQVKNDLFSCLITWINEDWNWDIWTTTSVADQSEYVIPAAASDTEGNLKISWVSINYNWETFADGTKKYIKAKLVRLGNLPENWNYYTNNQSKDKPIYYIADKSIFIAPHPATSEAGADRIELKGIKSILDYTITTTEDNIKIPLYLHDVLVQGLLPYIHRAEWRKDEASFEEKNYFTRRDLAVKKFTDRNNWAFYMNYPTDVDETTYTINLN